MVATPLQSMLGLDALHGDLRTIVESLLVLGGLLDKSLRRGLVLSGGSLVPFVTRPISAALASVILLTVLPTSRPTPDRTHACQPRHGC